MASIARVSGNATAFPGVLGDWRLLWLLLLLPVVFLLPPLPIDETRYLAVAWEMHLNGSYLVPQLNGAPYADKPPLLFWLINASWLITGVHAWSARLVALALSFASLLLLRQLAWRLSASRAFAMTTLWLLLGMLFFSVFASIIMFDVLLGACVLLGLHGLLDLERARPLRGVLVLALASGLGILAKGPVMLLDIAFPILLGPWWSVSARLQWRRWYGLALLGLAGGVALALAWAVPAALAGGGAYADAIFLHQTVDRMAKSFAHRRPFYWYLWVLPLMLLPWTLALRPRRATLRAALDAPLARFALAWVLPTFVAFSLISGKQTHYLLPILPGLALLGAHLLERDALRLRAGLFATLLAGTGAVLLALPFYARTHPNLAAFEPLWPCWGALLLALAAALWWQRARVGVRALAAASAASAVLGMLALAQAFGPLLDLRPVVAQIDAAQARGQPIVHIGWHHGLFEFAGRASAPLAAVSFGNLRAWCLAHPDGLVLSELHKYDIPAPPLFEQRYRLGHIALWRAADVLAAPALVPDASTPDDSEDASE